MVLHQYTLKEFAANPSKVVHRAMSGEEDVVITLRGLPVVRLVPAAGPPPRTTIEDVWSAMPGMSVPAAPMVLPAKRITLRGEGPTAADMILEDRR